MPALSVAVYTIANVFPSANFVVSTESVYEYTAPIEVATPVATPSTYTVYVTSFNEASFTFIITGIIPFT